MTKLKPEEEEFWDDYNDAVVDEFLGAQTNYFKTLGTQKLTRDRCVRNNSSPLRESSAIIFTYHTRVDTKMLLWANNEVFDARIRFERAIGSLQSMSVEDCRSIIDQINRIQKKDSDCELDISSMVRHLVIGRNTWRSRNVQKRKPWYLIVPSNGVGTSLDDLSPNCGCDETTQLELSGLRVNNH